MRGVLAVESRHHLVEHIAEDPARLADRVFAAGVREIDVFSDLEERDHKLDRLRPGRRPDRGGHPQAPALQRATGGRSHEGAQLEHPKLVVGVVAQEADPLRGVAGVHRGGVRPGIVVGRVPVRRRQGLVELGGHGADRVSPRQARAHRRQPSSHRLASDFGSRARVWLRCADCAAVQPAQYRKQNSRTRLPHWAPHGAGACSASAATDRDRGRRGASRRRACGARCRACAGCARRARPGADPCGSIAGCRPSPRRRSRRRWDRAGAGRASS